MWKEKIGDELIRILGFTLADMVSIVALFSAMAAVFRFLVVEPIKKDIDSLSKNISSLNTNLEKLEEQDKLLLEKLEEQDKVITDRIHRVELDIETIKQQVKTLFTWKGDTK